MGTSCDWTRNRFTLDERYHKAVLTAFKIMYDKGLIYRGTYMVNWCPGKCESAISNLEAEAEEVESNLWYLKYPIKTDDWQGPKGEWGSGKWAEGATEFIILATTRPETLLGDTGVAISLKHPEYSKYNEKVAMANLSRDRFDLDTFKDHFYGGPEHTGVEHSELEKLFSDQITKDQKFEIITKVCRTASELGLKWFRFATCRKPIKEINLVTV